MEESSRGKERTQPPNPSPLREVQQVPDSDWTVPETQLEANHDAPDQDDDPEDLAFLKRTTAKTPGKRTQPSSPSQMIFGVSKPAATVASKSPPAFSFGSSRWPNTASQHAVHAEMTIPSIKTATNVKPKQDTLSTSALLPVLESPPVAGLAELKIPNLVKVVSEHYSREALHSTAATTGQQGAGLPHTVLSTSFIGSGLESQLATKHIPRTQKKGNPTRIKKGKMALLSRPLVPWPPPRNSAPAESASPFVVGLAEPSQKVSQSTHHGGAPAVKSPQSGGAFRLTDGSCAPALTRAGTPEDEAPGGTASGGSLIETIDSLGREQPPRRPVDANAVVIQQSTIANPLIDTFDQPFFGPLGDRSDILQMQQASSVKESGSDETLTLSRSVVPPLEKSEKQIATVHLVYGDQGGFSDKPLPLKNTASKHNSPSNSQSRAMGGTKSVQSSSNTNALDRALNAFRDTCLEDWHRTEDRLTTVIDELTQDNAHLQDEISQYKMDATEMRNKLQASGDRFDRLKKEVIIKSKYIAGLQKDHEQMQSFKATFEQTFERQIAEAGQERHLMQREFDKVLVSSTRSQNSMMNTMKETHMHYVLALSRENDLRGQLEQQTRMHDAEKTRRIELEHQLLPSIQSMQHQLKESSAVVVDKLGSLLTDRENRAAKSHHDSSVEECLLILQRLQSLPLLTANDVRKVECMLRFLIERNVASFEPFPVDNIKQFLKNEIQELQASMLRHEQTRADEHGTQKTLRIHKPDLRPQQEDNQQLGEEVDCLRQTEKTLGIRVSYLEKENEDLRSTICDHEKLPRGLQSNTVSSQLQSSQAQENLSTSHNAMENQERLKLERERDFSDYRSKSIAYLQNLEERVVRMSDQIYAKEREITVLQQDAGALKARLGSAKSEIDHLTTQATQHTSEVERLRQEHHRVLEKEGRTRALLASSEEIRLRLEVEKERLSTAAKGYCTALHESKTLESATRAECLDLQRECANLKNLVRNKDAILQQVETNAEHRLQQVQKDHATQRADLESSLTLSENVRKELQSKLRESDAAHKQQIQCHEHKFDTKFAELVAKANQERDKLKVRHLQEMEQCHQDADAKVTAIIKETQEHLSTAGLASFTVLMPNTQHPRCDSSTPKQVQKRVNRQTKSTLTKITSKQSRLNFGDQQSATVRPESAHSRHRCGEESASCLEEEYEHIHESQTPSHKRGTQDSVIDHEAEVLPETQERQCSDRSYPQVQMGEPQPPGIDSLVQDEAATELSTMPSEDLTEMLLDLAPSRRTDSRRLSMSYAIVQSSKLSAHDSSSDGPSMSIEGRPKSQANTASRMIPLSTHDELRQHDRAGVNFQRSTRASTERGSDADIDTSSNFMLANNIKSKRKAASDFDTTAKKLRANRAQSPLPKSKSYMPHISAPTGEEISTHAQASPSSAKGRPSSTRLPVTSGFQSNTPQLSTTRNTRSKTIRYADRFGQELDRH